MPWRQAGSNCDILSDLSDFSNDDLEDTGITEDPIPVVDDDITVRGNSNASSSSWHVVQPQPKYRPEPRSYNSLTTERDMQEVRWRLARSLQSNMQNPFLLMPWQRTSQKCVTAPLQMVFRGDEYQSEPGSDTENETLVKRPRNTFASLKVRNMHWEEHEDLLRQRALVRWRIILEEKPSSDRCWPSPS